MHPTDWILSIAYVDLGDHSLVLQTELQNVPVTLVKTVMPLYWMAHMA